LAKLYDYDIILLDLTLPDVSGYTVLRALRFARVVTPVLIVSGLVSIEDKIRALGLGADDYLTKPFREDELIARIHALVRRSKGHAESAIAVGDLIVNVAARIAEMDGQRLNLSDKEYQVLALLALRRGSTLAKETFLNHLYRDLGGPNDKNHRCFHLQTQEETRQRQRRPGLYRDRLGASYAPREPTGARPRADERARSKLGFPNCHAAIVATESKTPNVVGSEAQAA
jgi:two-component system cell cycle response regulator CtrA